LKRDWASEKPTKEEETQTFISIMNQIFEENHHHHHPQQQQNYQ